MPTLTPFAADLERGREAQRDRRDPAWCIIAAVAAAHGIKADPLDGIGVQDEWYADRYARDTAGRLLYVALGWSLREVGERMGLSGSAYSGCGRRPLDAHEIELLEAAEDLHGKPLA